MDIRPWLRRRRRPLSILALLALGAAATPVLLDYWVGASTDAAVTDDTDALRPAPVGLVLGTAKQGRYGINQFYRARIYAAAELYKSGAVRGLIVSGDNSRPDYDEPTDMYQDLIALGVPAEHITRDYAGLRTLDSVIRAREVFGQDDLIIVSQRFHCQRAVFIARRHGISAQGYAAADPAGPWSAKVRAREVAARSVCVADLYLLHRAPRHLGDPVPVKLAENTED